MSPILVRPVREQLEHDRIIRLLQDKVPPQYEAGMNPGVEQNVAVGTGPSALYPDLVLSSPERGHKLQIVVEVETGESVNHLEALAQWAHFSKTTRGVPPLRARGMVDVARRLCEDNQIHVAEIWSYHIGRRRGAVHAGAPQPRGAAGPRPAARQRRLAAAPRPAPAARNRGPRGKTGRPSRSPLRKTKKQPRSQLSPPNG